MAARLEHSCTVGSLRTPAFLHRHLGPFPALRGMPALSRPPRPASRPGRSASPGAAAAEHTGNDRAGGRGPGARPQPASARQDGGAASQKPPSGLAETLRGSISAVPSSAGTRPSRQAGTSPHSCRLFCAPGRAQARHGRRPHAMRLLSHTREERARAWRPYRHGFAVFRHRAGQSLHPSQKVLGARILSGRAAAPCPCPAGEGPRRAPRVTPGRAARALRRARTAAAATGAPSRRCGARRLQRGQLARQARDGEWGRAAGGAQPRLQADVGDAAAAAPGGRHRPREVVVAEPGGAQRRQRRQPGRQLPRQRVAAQHQLAERGQVAQRVRQRALRAAGPRAPLSWPAVPRRRRGRGGPGRRARQHSRASLQRRRPAVWLP